MDDMIDIDKGARKGVALDLDKPVDLAALGDFLLSDAAPTAMDLSELDGFLTGILAGPELIMPSEWLPEVWGEEEPAFESAEEAAVILELLMGRYNQIARGIESDPLDLEPIACTDDEGAIDASPWCEGFGQALALRADAWEPLLESEAGLALMPILALCRGGDDRLLLEQGLGDDGDDLDAREMAQLIPTCAAAVAMYWREHRRRGEGLSVETFGVGRRPKVGRNATCSCGSGADAPGELLGAVWGRAWLALEAADTG